MEENDDQPPENAEETNRFQFTIKGLLWATFWVAVAFAGLIIARDEWYRLSRTIGTCFVLALCIAACALFGQSPLALARHLPWTRPSFWFVLLIAGFVAAGLACIIALEIAFLSFPH